MGRGLKRKIRDKEFPHQLTEGFLDVNKLKTAMTPFFEYNELDKFRIVYGAIASEDKTKLGWALYTRGELIDEIT